MEDAIGGYFSLELNQKRLYHQGVNCFSLNTGRNCLEYILEANSYSLLYIPYFSCEVILEPLKKLNIDFKFYSIDENLEPIFDFKVIKRNEAFLFINYFGIKDKYIDKLVNYDINLIIDNSQSFFSKALTNIDTFYSARKFIGVADGAYLYTQKVLNRHLEQDTSFTRMDHLFKRLDVSAEEGYLAFVENDNKLINQPIKKMSKLTKFMLESVDYDVIKSKRLENFHYLNNELQGSNKFIFDLNDSQIPMVYPFWNKDLSLRERLISNRIYCAKYWPNVKEWSSMDSLECRLVNEVVYLPIDQRYDVKMMKEILKYV
jgi:hypothetical protein